MSSKSLTAEQIISFTKGALWSRETEEGIRFFRCTEKQRSAWTALREVLGQRSGCTTGIRVDFLSDATDVSFDIGRHGKYELYIDGSFVRQEKRDGAFTFSHTIKAEQDGHMHRVTLWLPSHSAGSVKGITLGGGERTEAPEYGPKFLFLGDSITQGWNSVLDSNSFAIRMTRALNADSVNQGVGGGIFCADVLDEISFDPDVVFTAFGTNDFSYFRGRPDDFVAAMDAYFTYLKELFPDKPVVAVSPIYRFFKNDAELAEFEVHCDRIRAAIKRHGFILAEGYDMVPHDIKLYDDGLHPVDSGFEYFADELLKITGTILK